MVKRIWDLSLEELAEIGRTAARRAIEDAAGEDTVPRASTQRTRKRETGPAHATAK